jgi:hypothetical protein
MFLIETDKTIRLSKTEPPTDFDPLLLNGALFNLLYKNTFLPSLFVKPTRFSGEEELRLAFEMPRDVPPPLVLRTNDKSLLKYIEVVR